MLLLNIFSNPVLLHKKEQFDLKSYLRRKKLDFILKRQLRSNKKA